MIDIPIVGKITTGLPRLTIENIEDTLPLPVNFIKHDRELFILRISDESRVNVGIRNNDLTIIENSQTAKNGEIVAALIGNHPTIKRFLKKENHIRL